MSDTPRTKEEWKRLQRLPNGLYTPKVTTMDLAIGMNRFAGALERECDGLRRAYDIALRQMNQAIAKAEWLRTDAIVDLERDKARLDWLADPANPCGNVTLPAAIVNRNLHSLRAAIDETMANPLSSPSE